MSGFEKLSDYTRDSEYPHLPVTALKLSTADIRRCRRWTEVARVVGTRHADRGLPKPRTTFLKLTALVECAKRWLHFLNPELDYSEWTQREDELLLAGVRTNGRNWRRIVNEILRGRSATDAKNRCVTNSRAWTKSCV